VLFVPFLATILISCSSQNNQTLDGEYYWINENRNERVFTVDISGTKHDYYLKGSEAYKKALKKIWIRLERIGYE